MKTSSLIPLQRKAKIYDGILLYWEHSSVRSQNRCVTLYAGDV